MFTTRSVFSSSNNSEDGVFFSRGFFECAMIVFYFCSMKKRKIPSLIPIADRTVHRSSALRKSHQPLLKLKLEFNSLLA